jgi:CRP-like cAMP-binding protein
MAELPSIAELAAVSRLFALLDEVGGRRLLASAVRRSAAAGEVVCREGERGEEFYVLLGGTVAVTADDFGSPRLIARLGRGSFFGEMAMLTSQPRSATATVEEPADLLVFGRAAVEEALRANPLARQALGKVGVKRTEELLEKLASD